MDYLTEYYKQLCESLEYIQEILTYKKILNEAKVSPTDVDFLTIQARGEDALSQLKNKYGNIKENLPPNLRSDLESYTKAMRGEIQKQPTYQPTKEVPRTFNYQEYLDNYYKEWDTSATVKPTETTPTVTKPSAPNPWEDASKSLRDLQNKKMVYRYKNGAGMPANVIWKVPSPKAEEGGKVVSTSPVKPTETTPTVTKPSAPKSSLGSKIVSGIKGIAGFGAGMVGYGIGRGISDTAMNVVGVENQVARDIAGEAVGGAGFGTAAAATGTALKGGGLIGLKAAGSAAGLGAMTGLAAYGGYKAGEAISDIEVDEKGTTVSDVIGKKLYDVFTPGSFESKVNTPKTGVAGGDQAKIAQNQQEDEEEKAKMARKQAAEKSRVEGRAARIAKKVAAIKAGKTTK